MAREVGAEEGELGDNQEETNGARNEVRDTIEKVELFDLLAGEGILKEKGIRLRSSQS